LLNIVAGSFQFILTPGERVSMLFYEPSSAAYFLLTVVAFCFYDLRRDYLNKFIAVLFVVSSLLISSKAMYLIFIIIALIILVKSSSFRVKVSLILSGGLLFVIIYLNHEYLKTSNDLYRSVVIFIDVFSKMGLQGLSIEHGVYGTFVTRITSVYASIVTFINHPLGVGFGSFGFIYSQVLSDLGLIGVVSGAEVDMYLSGEMIPSPKSKLLEILLSTGWLGLIILSLVFYKVRKTRNKQYTLAFLTFFMASALIELNNFYLYIFMLVAFFETKLAKYNEKN
jgi:hypothetical protein